MFRPDALNPGNSEFTAASEAAYRLLTAAVERCHEAGRLHGRSAEVVAVSAWSLVHGLSALSISGRLSERITEQIAATGAAVDLFTAAVLPPRAPKPAPTRRRPRQSLHLDRTISMGIPQRNSWKKARMSLTGWPGDSMAAKGPPWSMSVQRVTLWSGSRRGRMPMSWPSWMKAVVRRMARAGCPSWGWRSRRRPSFRRCR